MVVRCGGWREGALPLCGERGRREIFPRASSLPRISRIRGPSGSRTPPPDRPKKYGTAAPRRKDRFHTWRRRLAVGESIGPSAINSLSLPETQAVRICIPCPAAGGVLLF